jgi:lipopolysaccharide transport system permease protein
MAMTLDVEFESVVDESLEPPPSMAAQALTIITPPTGRAVVDVAELWRARDLLYFLAWRDVKVRYKQTVLGAAWAVLQPALMMVVFTLFFSRMAGMSSGEIPYPLFAYAGLLPWTFFTTAVASAGNSVIGSERIITKVYFPRLAIPFAAVAAAVVDFLIAVGLLAGMMVWYGTAPGPFFWLALLIFASITLGALGVGTMLAALNVSYRDFRYVIPFLLQLWMFATPSIYMQANAPRGGALGVALKLNPMTGLIEAFRASVLGGPIPWGALLMSSLCSAVLFVAGCLYFRKAEDKFADVI